MFETELQIRGKSAKIICPNHRSVFISCDGFGAYLLELEALQHLAAGKTRVQIAEATGATHQMVSNRLMFLRRRNSHLGDDDFHYAAVMKKAMDLELLDPLALLGLRATLDKRNAYYRNRRVRDSAGRK